MKIPRACHNTPTRECFDVDLALYTVINGKSVSDAARQYRVSANSVYRRYHKKYLDAPVGQRIGPPSLKELQVNHALHLFESGACTITEAALAAGCSRYAIYLRLEKMLDL